MIESGREYPEQPIDPYDWGGDTTDNLGDGTMPQVVDSDEQEGSGKKGSNNS